MPHKNLHKQPLTLAFTVFYRRKVEPIPLFHDLGSLPNNPAIANRNSQLDATTSTGITPKATPRVTIQNGTILISSSHRNTGCIPSRYTLTESTLRKNLSYRRKKRGHKPPKTRMVLPDIRLRLPLSQALPEPVPCVPLSEPEPAGC